MSTTTMNNNAAKSYPNTFRFMDYRVYQESKKWHQEALSLKGVFAANSDLWNQLKIHTTSVVMNIAAASTKLPEQAKFSLGSSITAANKAVACLDIACDLQAITPDEFQLFSEGFKGVIIQLKGIIKKMGLAASKTDSVEESK
ncbi:MAG: hypothetical protein AB7J40_05680 [Candidatus Altimarinota bacterium]